MLNEQLSNLKVSLRKEREFAVIMSQFLDISEGNRDLHERSRRIKVKLLKTLLETGSTGALQKAVKVRDILALEVRKKGFIHGTFRPDEASMGAFFFFRDERMGLATILTASMQHYFRLTFDIWDEEGESLPGDPLDIDPDLLEH